MFFVFYQHQAAMIFTLKKIMSYFFHDSFHFSHFEGLYFKVVACPLRFVDYLVTDLLVFV
jgi:hypothetical protein